MLRSATVRATPLLLLLMCILLLPAAPRAQGGRGAPPPPPAQAAALVQPAALAKFLPTVTGWTRGDVRSSQVDISAECCYAFSSVTYVKDQWRLKVTIADTGAREENLLALAAPVLTLPEDCVNQVPPATTIKRIKMGEHPAAEMWDAEKSSGELMVVLNGRFVALVEASKAENIDALRAVLSAVDLKALAALK